MTDENVVTIDGQTYNQGQFTPQQNYLLKQIDDLQTKAGTLKFQLDQVEVAKQAFLAALKTELGEAEDDADAVAAG